MITIDLQWFGESEETKRVEATNQTNRDIAAENLAYQREWNDYQKSLNDKLMQREDSAIQRQVADARLAGVSPLAAGNVGQAQSSGSASVTGAPLNNQFQAQTSQKSRGMENIEMIASLVNTASQVVGQMSDMAQSVQNIRAGISNNNFLRDSYQDRLNAVKYDANFKGWNLYDFMRDASYNHEYGLTRGMSERERFIRSFLSSENGKKTLSANLNPFDPLSGKTEISTPRNLTFDDVKKALVQYILGEDTDFSPAKKTMKKIGDTTDTVIDKVDDMLSSALDKINKPVFSTEKKYKTDPKKSKFDGIQKGGR